MLYKLSVVKDKQLSLFVILFQTNGLFEQMYSHSRDLPVAWTALQDTSPLPVIPSLTLLRVPSPSGRGKIVSPLGRDRKPKASE